MTMNDPRYSIDFSTNKYNTRYDRLMNILYYAKELPSKLCNSMNMSYENYKQTIYKLRQKGLIQTVRKDGMIGYRLTLKAKRSVVASECSQYRDCFDDSDDRHMDVSRRRRRRNFAYLYTLFDRVGIPFESFRKPVLDKSAACDENVSFYSAKEIKQCMGIRSTAINGSIHYGCFIGRGMIVPVYMGYGRSKKLGKHEALVPFLMEGFFRASASKAVVVCPFDWVAIDYTKQIIENVCNDPKVGLNTGKYSEFYTFQDDDRFLSHLSDLYNDHTEIIQDVIEEYVIDTSDKDGSGRRRFKVGTGFIDGYPTLVCAGNVDVIKLKRFIRNTIAAYKIGYIFCKQRDYSIVSEIVKDTSIGVIEI